jgi:serine/threonine protein phosphatase 1
MARAASTSSSWAEHLGVHFLDAKAPPGMRLYAIGDVHGRLDLLERMHEAIAAEIARDRPDDWRVVHLGDYVDRGPASKGVLDLVADLTARDPRMIALAGNHDIGMLDFLASPATDGLFIRFGGIETARSYGVHLAPSAGRVVAMGEAALREGHAALREAVPESHLDLLGALPRCAEFGDFFFCHAGIRPGIPLARQSPEDLIWIRRDFLDWPSPHPRVIVHGHTPCAQAEIMPNRVNVDTLAYETGRLTALVVDGADKRILEVAGRPAPR